MIISWWMGTIVGSVCLVTLNTYERVHLLTDPKSYVVILPLLFCMNLGFWYGFYHAPSFIQAWFLGSAMCAVGAWLSHVVILKESVDLPHIVGFFLVVTGAYFLSKH